MSANDSAPRSPEPAGATLRRLLTGAVVAVAAVWAWSAFCRFPAEFWNDMRTAAAVALARGHAVYPTAGSGVVNTWTYGPLPLLALAPAALAREPATSLLIAGAINLALLIGALGVTVLAWPGGLRGRARLGAAAIGVGAAVLLWPESPLRCYYSDTPAVACGLVASVLLARADGRRGLLWLAALLAAAALACKQTALGIPLAHLVWLGIAQGWRAAAAHLGRGFVAGGALGLGAVAWFGWEPLRFVLLDLPSGFPAAPDPLARLGLLAGPLALHLGVPLAVLALARRDVFRRDGPLLLPTLLWLASLPLGVAALLRLGGGLNSLHSFVLWLPPVLALVLTHGSAERRARAALAVALVALGAGVWRGQTATQLPVRPQTAVIIEGTAIAREFPGRVWFPLNPLITLQTEGRYYCDEDGIYVRNAAGRPATFAQLLPHLPPRWSAIALRYRRDPAWGTAEHMIPRDARIFESGAWRLMVWAPLREP